jgi:hypothetical protein
MPGLLVKSICPDAENKNLWVATTSKEIPIHIVDIAVSEISPKFQKKFIENFVKILQKNWRENSDSL